MHRFLAAFGRKLWEAPPGTPREQVIRIRAALLIGLLGLAVLAVAGLGRWAGWW